MAVINEAFAKKFFPDEDPVGHHFGMYEQEDMGAYEIVGVVANAKYSDPHEAAKAMVFEPLAQWQHNLKEPIFVNLETQTHHVGAVVMEFYGTQQKLEEAVWRTLAEIDPNLAVISMRSLDAQLSGNFSQERMVARLTIVFGLLALVLTSVGLYGITAYQATQRTREIGMRMRRPDTRGRHGDARGICAIQPRAAGGDSDCSHGRTDDGKAALPGEIVRPMEPGGCYFGSRRSGCCGRVRSSAPRGVY